MDVILLVYFQTHLLELMTISNNIIQNTIIPVWKTVQDIFNSQKLCGHGIYQNQYVRMARNWTELGFPSDFIFESSDCVLYSLKMLVRFMINMRGYDVVNIFFNSSPVGPNGRHFLTFHMHFREWKFCILLRISLKFVPKGSIDNNPVLVQIMAWRRIGDKPLCELMLTQFTDAYMRH